MFTSIGDNGRLLEELHRQLATNLGVVPFVGAGMCVPCGLPQWSALLKQVADDCGKSMEIDHLIGNGQFEEAASTLERSMGTASFSARLREWLSPQAVTKLAGPILQVPALTRGPVVTTNFDNVIEQVFERSGFPFPRVGLGPQVDAVWGALHQDQPFLLKIHGALDDPDTRVLTLEDYQRAYGSRDATHATSELPLPRLLEQIFTSRTLLFLGCSLNLDRTLLYLRRVKRDHGAPALHFALLQDPGDASLRAERAHFLASINIRPIWYPTNRHDLIGEVIEEVMEPRFHPSFPLTSKKVDAARLGGRIGIDFGTSFSAVAYSPDGLAIEYCQLVPDDGRALIPSVVRFLDGLEYTIGDDRPVDSSRVLAEIRHFKRDLGSRRRYRVGRRDYTPGDVATLFLRGVRIALAAQVSGEIPPVIASAPANFGTYQINELTNALRQAGFSTIRVVGEPCAAALNVREFTSEEEVWFLVIDIGGGTTDISIVVGCRVDGNIQVEILGVAGDNALGGLDFDAVICELVREKFVHEFGTRGGALFERHRSTIEGQATVVKIALNSQPRAFVILADVELDPGRLETITLEIERSAFQIACAPLLHRIERLIEATVMSAFQTSLEGLARIGWPYGRPGAVMLAGQTSKLVLVRSFLEERIGLPLVDRFQEVAVARGLAQQASVLGGSLKDLLMLDVTYRGIYFAFLDNMFTLGVRDILRPEKAPTDCIAVKDHLGRPFMALCEKNTTIPTTTSMILAFRSAQSSVTLDLFESDDDPDTPFKPIEKLLIRFTEPASWMDIAIEIDADRTIDLHLGTARFRKSMPFRWWRGVHGDVSDDERRVRHRLNDPRSGHSSRFDLARKLKDL